MTRRARALALTLCLVLVAGAGCTGDDKKQTAQRPDTTAPKQDIVVGAIFDLSGPNADSGTPYSKGVRDYVEYKNANGGVDGHSIDLHWQDFGYKVPAAEELYDDYVARGARAFIGWAADDTDALRPRVTRDRVAFMSAAYAETLTDPKLTPYHFFPGASYSQQMRIALQYIADQTKGKGRTEVAVFHHDSPFGVSPLEDGKRYIETKKLDLGFKSYPMPDHATDYLAQVGQAKTQGARYVIVQNTFKPAAQLAKDLAAQKANAQIICLNWCADDLFVKLAGQAAEKMIGVMPFAPPAVAAQGLEDLTNFLKTKSTDAASVGVHYLKGWFTMATMAEGIANALRAHPDKVDGDAIKAGLEKITDYKTGVSAPISFRDDYHAGMKAVGLYQVESGAFKKIADPITVDR